MTKQPRSWWPAEGEIRLSKRHDKVVLGGEQVIGPYDEESCRVVKNPLLVQGQAGVESWLLGRRPRTVRRAWTCSTQEPVGVEGAERSHSPSRNRRDPSRHRLVRPGVATPRCPVEVNSISGEES